MSEDPDRRRDLNWKSSFSIHAPAGAGDGVAPALWIYRFEHGLKNRDLLTSLWLVNESGYDIERLERTSRGVFSSYDSEPVIAGEGGWRDLGHLADGEALRFDKLDMYDWDSSITYSFRIHGVPWAGREVTTPLRFQGPANRTVLFDRPPRSGDSQDSAP